MYQRRQQRLVQALRTAGMDACLVSGFKNVQYLCGFHSTMPGEIQIIGDPEGFLLIQPDSAHLLCDGRYITGAEQLPDVKAVRIESPTSPQNLFNTVDKLLQPAVRTLGVEFDNLTHSDALGLMQTGGRLAWKPADAVLSGLRLCKTPEEIECVRTAQKINNDCFKHVLTKLKPGVTERQIAVEIETFLKVHSEGNSFAPIVAFGETSCNPHYIPSADRKLARGQTVLLDFGSIYNGYCGDMTRMAFAGRADDRQKQVYQWVLEAQKRGLAAVRPGALAHDIDAACRDYFKSQGCADAFGHGTGHGVGLAIHEAPKIKQSIQTRIEPGMIFSIEPGLYFKGWGGVRIEDLVAVTESGCDNLTITPKDLVELEL